TTPGTTRPARAPTPTRARGRDPQLHLTRFAEEGGAAADAEADDRVTAAGAGLALARVHVVVVLELAGLPVEVDVLLVGKGRTAVLHRVLQRLHHRPVQPADLLGGERVAPAV